MNDKQSDSFDWMKFLKAHPLVVAATLVASGATGGISVYIAFSALIDNAAGLAVNARIEELRKSLGAFPPDAVVAFDLKGGCPTGWDNVTDTEEGRQRFAGRFIVAAGPAQMRSEGGSTEERKFRIGGGEERVTLETDQMPNHRHAIYPHSGVLASNDPAQSIPRAQGAGATGEINQVRNGVTGAEGGGQSHNNMPPYIALHYCKKNKA
ncbi:hypothetical protein [Zhengella mangrovi]|uniref:hypothetical protein n=1 Tax=Zhengella mangrovi TaxID=1982044 RepID=UPI0010562931|nr:hypothetical protein [Zhengella mangrovi]